ncbi:uncharacterized protein LOC115483378 [Drosophila hydei]|uniref:Uncharacterized protein LOC115483378 n=1 Tax=Drosophila hydei TaxID=7224 RepID=A0A6J2ST69_DROHY|nr:uncharacterized protein LOC115483378 [Drosophila hydei]
MTNLVCETYNKSWFLFNTCRLRAISRNKTCLYLNATVLHPAYNIHARAEVYQKANGWTSLPHAIPTGDYLLGITWIFDNRPQFATKVYFAFKEDLKANP